MHGLILVQLQKFASQTIGAQQWRNALTQAGLENTSFSAGTAYDDARAFELVGVAASTLGIPINDVVESFGRFLAMELIRLYQRVIKPEWKTLDLIENTETLIHSAVRTSSPGAMPPVLDAIRISNNELQLLYSSNRKLCKLAIGIIKGLADHFQEVIDIQHDSCMLMGDAFCSFRLSRSAAKQDTEKITLGNTLQLEIDPRHTKTVLSDANGNPQGSARSTEPTQWDRYLSPALNVSDVGSIGPYRLLAKQGEGGMGCVFRSIDTRTEQSVAVKILHPKVADDPTIRSRFMRELQALQRVKSSHVVEVKDVGQIGELPYLVMEYLRGTNLHAYRMRFQRLPIHEIVRIAIETVNGLAAVHQAGIIHRDIKPDNLWVETPSLNIKIIDFGLAHAVAEEMRLTRTGSFIGTPSFMAPEQAGTGNIDHRADFFSLGCVLYELATGIRPFDKGNIIATLSALANHTPDSPATIAPDFPIEFSVLIMKMLQKNPEDRPQDCQEILSVLNRIRTSIN